MTQSAARAPVTIGMLASHPTGIRRFGSGPRPALALHCSLAHGGAWSLLAQGVPGLSVTAPDLPGHGESADPGARDLHALATGIAAELLESIGEGQPVDLLGHSFGGTVALRLALLRPDLVRSLTLVEPVLFAAAKGHPASAVNLAGQQAVDALLATDPAAAAALFHREWGGGIPFAALPEQQRRYFAERMRYVSALGPVLFEDAAGMLCPGQLERLTMPVLLAEGSESPQIVGAIFDTLERRLGDVRRLRVEGAGHMLPITHPAPLAAAVTELLAIS